MPFEFVFLEMNRGEAATLCTIQLLKRETE